jgi:D-tyrosyl-tRNA(Tyr) deacylase
LLATVQRVIESSVYVENREISSIKNGLLIFACIEDGDTTKSVKDMADKIFNFRILDGPKGAMSASIKDSTEEVLIISQFTLAAITTKGKKPSFHKAANPDDAKILYDEFVTTFKNIHTKVKEGEFGASMNISLINNGPVTFNFKT